MENFVADDTIQREQDTPAIPQAEGIKVRFNHQDMMLSPDDAVAYAQKGLKLDSIEPLLKELSYLSALRGKSALDTVREYISLDEEIAKMQLGEQYKDDPQGLEDALQKYKSDAESKRKGLFEEDVLKEREEQERNFTDEFFELQRACPEIDSLEKIPKDVFKDAKEMSLLNAYLRFFHREQTKILKEQKTQANNLKAAAGDLHGGGESYDTLLSAFIKGPNS